MTHERLPHRSKAAGFTLIELLVVAGIIVVAGAIALPGIARYMRNYAIRGAAQQVGGAIQQARLNAISKNVNLGVVLWVLNQTQYQIVVEDDQRPGAGAVALSPPTWRMRSAEDWTSVTSITGQTSPVQTLPNGILFDNPANCPSNPAFPTANDWGVRFGRLGNACSVATGTAPCNGNPGVNPPGGTSYVSASGTASTVCVFQPATGLRRWVSVTAGGRVQVMP